MTICVSHETGNYIAQCDKCHDVVDFEPGADFFEVKFAIEMDGWRLQRNNGKWFNICVDCVK